MTELELGWLVGILEGEGCFAWASSKNRNHYGWPRVLLTMTDRDVIEHAAQLMCAKSVKMSKKEKPHHKQPFRCSVQSSLAIDLMRKILPFMGERRAAKIKELLFLWDNRPALAARKRSIAKAHKIRLIRVVKESMYGIAPTRIRQLLVEQGLSCWAIARVLNAEGIPTRTGRGRWWPSQVSRVADEHAESVR